MAHTVIGLFENDSQAQQAVQQLESIGISRQHVDISRGSGSAGNVSSDRSDEKESGVTRFFKSLFGDDSDEADRLSRVSSRGHSIVTVHAQSEEQAERAADVLDDYGAVDVDERDSQYSSDSGYRATASRTSGDSEDQTIERVEENLRVGKRTEERGGVRVRSRIVERPVEEHIRLRDEEVHVERTAVNRPVTDSDRASFQEREIELTERTEIPVVQKEARVVEEIRISKEVTERDETIHDTVRNTEVDVDKLDSNDRTRDLGTDNRSSL